MGVDRSWLSQLSSLGHSRNTKVLGSLACHAQSQQFDLVELFSLDAQVSLTILKDGYQAIQKQSADPLLQQSVLKVMDRVDPRLIGSIFRR